MAERTGVEAQVPEPEQGPVLALGREQVRVLVLEPGLVLEAHPHPDLRLARHLGQHLAGGPRRGLGFLHLGAALPRRDARSQAARRQSPP